MELFKNFHQIENSYGQANVEQANKKRHSYAESQCKPLYKAHTCKTSAPLLTFSCLAITSGAISTFRPALTTYQQREEEIYFVFVGRVHGYTWPHGLHRYTQPHGPHINHVLSKSYCQKFWITNDSTWYWILLSKTLFKSIYFMIVWHWEQTNTLYHFSHV